MRARQKTATSTEQDSSGTLAISQATTLSLAATRSKLWTVARWTLCASLASPHPKSATTAFLGSFFTSAMIRSSGSNGHWFAWIRYLGPSEKCEKSYDILTPHGSFQTGWDHF